MKHLRLSSVIHASEVTWCLVAIRLHRNPWIFDPWFPVYDRENRKCPNLFYDFLFVYNLIIRVTSVNDALHFRQYLQPTSPPHQSSSNKTDPTEGKAPNRINKRWSHFWFLKVADIFLRLVWISFMRFHSVAAIHAVGCNIKGITFQLTG